MFTRINHTAFLAALGIAASAAMVATPASAQAETQSKAVHFDDLDLGTETGADTLHHRVRSAVRSVCAVNKAQTLKEKMNANACSKVAMADATPRVQLAVAQARTNQGYAANSISIRTGR